MKIYIFLFVSFFSINATLTAQTYLWTAEGDGVSLYQEANWKFNGSSPSQIDPNIPINFDLLINSGTVGGGGFSGILLLGGHSLTINGGNVIGNAGIESFSSNTTQKSTIIANGGLVKCLNMSDINLQLKNDAQITLTNIINPFLRSKIDINSNYTGKITLTNISLSEALVTQLPNFTVNGVPAVNGVNIFFTAIGTGTIIKLIPIQESIGNRDYNDKPIPNKGPNIIYILLDDLGYGDLGNFWQNHLSTDKKMLSPNLDKMANEGALLTNHYTAAPVCAPARASFLEGLSQGHSSVRNNQFDKAAKNGLTLAELLRQSGYRTMHVGKNGLAGGRTSDLTAHPLKRGFDQFYGYLFHNQGHEHYPQNGTTTKEAFFTDGYTDIKEGTDLTYTTDVFTAKSKEWIITHEASRPEQPFFLYLAYDVPHNVMEVPTQAYPAGGGLTGGLKWTSLYSPTPWVNTASGTMDSYIHSDYASKNWNMDEKKYATMIRRVDDAVKDIIQLLKDLKIDEKTLIVFSSDNGPSKEGQLPTSFQSYGNFNGIKRDLWEGGIKMPTICRYPGVISENTKVTFPSGQWDWLATFAELAGVPVPVYTDGVSLMPSLKRDNANQKNKGYLYHEYYEGGKTPSYSDFDLSKRDRQRNEMQVIRMGDFKGVRYDIKNNADNFEIYNINTDERESYNLAANMPDLQQLMKDKVLQVRQADLSAIRPYDNELIPAVKTSSFINGLNKNIYNEYCQWVPNFENLVPINTSVSDEINLDSAGLTTNFGISYTGFLDIPTDGKYTFYLETSSKCHIMLHDIHLLDNDFEYSPLEKSATLNLKAGKHPIRIYYQQNEVITPKLNLKLEGPGMSKTNIPNTMFFTNSTLSIRNEKSFPSFNLILYPQSVKDDLKGVLNTTESTSYAASVYSITGQKVISVNELINSSPGRNYINIPITKLSAGFYILNLVSTDNDKNIIKKFIKY